MVSIIPDELLFPSDELTMSASVSHNPAALQIVDHHHGRGSDGFTRTIKMSVGPAGLQLPSGDQVTTAAGNSQNRYISESPPHVTIQMDDSPLQSGTQTITTTRSSAGSSLPITNSREEEDHNINDSIKLGKTLLGLTFQAAVALMTVRFQLQGKSSPSSFSSAKVWVTMVCGFALTLIGMMLRKAHSTAANLSGYAGIFSVALGFFLMMEMYVPVRFGWSVWTAAGILLLAFAYSLAKRS